jgi:hypothetical protein
LLNRAHTNETCELGELGVQMALDHAEYHRGLRAGRADALRSFDFNRYGLVFPGAADGN